MSGEAFWWPSAEELGYSYVKKEVSLDNETLEILSEAAHDVWVEGKLGEGFVYGLVTDKAAKIHSCLVPYAELSETDKESDRSLVRGIPAILAKAGYVMVKA